MNSSFMTNPHATKLQLNGTQNLNHHTISSVLSHQKSHQNSPVILDVWEENFEEEFRVIMDLIDYYPIVAMDTEFPGTVYEFEEHDLSPIGHYEMKYKKIKMNVDKLKVIQVGISLADEEGNMPPRVTTWQFNLKFNLNTDDYSKDSIQLLINAGLNFDHHAKRGISSQQFAEYLIASGLVMNKDIKWICFDGGYDFAYLIKIFERQNLPENESQFYQLLNIYFPSIYDVKYMVRDIETLRFGGLTKIASDLNVKRFGTMHQAGSDALLTLSTFFKFRKLYATNGSETKSMNILEGIPQNSTDDLWRKTLVPEYPYMMFNGYGMHNMPIMDTSYFGQTDIMYNGVTGNNAYKMPFNFYPSYGGVGFQEVNAKPKKYDLQGGKSKNQSKN